MNEERQKTQHSLAKIENYANDLIAKHLPEGWTFAWNNRAHANGVCNYGKMEIQLSKKLNPFRMWDDIHETIIHEIAHAIAGWEAKHGVVFQRVFKSLGGSGNRCSSDNASVHVAHKWEMRYGSEVVKRYFRKPGKTTFEKLPHTWLTNRKEETYGKLTIVQVR